MNMSQFMLSVVSSLVAAVIGFFSKAVISNYGSFLKAIKSLLNYNKYVRFSMSYIFRIKINDKYLLIKGERINQLQPVGGVYKIYNTSKLHDFGAIDDKNIPVDENSKNDLRVSVKGKNVLKFLKWYNSKRDREVSIHREFYEELIKPGYLRNFSIKDFKPEFLKSVSTPMHFSTHFQCLEILQYDIFELKLNESHKRELLNAINNSNGKLQLVSADDILSLNTQIEGVSINIGKHAKHTI